MVAGRVSRNGLARIGGSRTPPEADEAADSARDGRLLLSPVMPGSETDSGMRGVVGRYVDRSALDS